MFNYHFETVSMSDLLNMNMMLNCLDFERNIIVKNPPKILKAPISLTSNNSWVSNNYSIQYVRGSWPSELQTKGFWKKWCTCVLWKFKSESWDLFWLTHSQTPKFFVPQKHHGSPRRPAVCPSNAMSTVKSSSLGTTARYSSNMAIGRCWSVI